jgi:hypothetical protein
MKEEEGIDLESSVDDHFNDSAILRLIITRNFDYKRVMADLKVHVSWRKSNVPLPILQDATLKVLNKGLIYIHGRSKNL